MHLCRLDIPSTTCTHLLLNQNMFIGSSLVGGKDFYVQVVPVAPIPSNAFVNLGLVFISWIAPLLDRLGPFEESIGDKHSICFHTMECFYLFSLFDTRYSENNYLIKYFYV